MPMNILELLDGKWTDGTRPKDIYELYISKNPSDYVKAIIEGLSSEKRKVQSGSAELASLLSKNNPELIYPHINLFIDNLDAEAPVLRWEAVCTLGNLTKADKNRIIPAYIDHIVPFLSNKSIILQGHSVRALSKIAASNEIIISSLRHLYGLSPISARRPVRAFPLQTCVQKDQVSCRVRLASHIFSGRATV